MGASMSASIRHHPRRGSVVLRWTLLFLAALSTAMLSACGGDSGEATGQQADTPAADVQTQRGAELTTQEYAAALEEVLARSAAEAEDAFQDAYEDSIGGLSPEDLDRLFSLETDGSWSEQDREFASEFAGTLLPAVTDFWEVLHRFGGDGVDEVSSLRPPEHLSDLHGNWTATLRESVRFNRSYLEHVRAVDTDIKNREELADFIALLDSLEGDAPIDPEFESQSNEVLGQLAEACLDLESQLEAELERDVNISCPEHETAPPELETAPAPTTPLPESAPETEQGSAFETDSVTIPEPTAEIAEIIPEASAGSVETDREALVALYNATDGPNWADNTNWLSDRPLGEWYGVETDISGRVIDVNLSENQLRGTIPAELGNLPYLDSLHLRHNALSGEIPAELGQLSYLFVVDLSNNVLSGEIPAELGQLFDLFYLSLGQNELSGEIPAELGQLSYLEILYLWSNELSGEIPAELGQLSYLKDLELGGNELSGEIPAELGQLSNLETLYLWGNELSGKIPAELGQLSNLEELYLQANELSGEIPAELGQLSSLETLDLQVNELSGEIPAELGQLSNLEDLNLGDNELSGEIPAALGQLSNLERLYLGYENALTGCVPDALRDVEVNDFDELGLPFC